MRGIRKIVNGAMMKLHPKIRVGSQMGLKAWKGFFCDSESQIKVGNISVRNNCHIEAKIGGTIQMGDQVNFNYNCIVIAHDAIIFGDNVSVGPNVIIYDHDHDYKKIDWRKKFITKKVQVGNNVWIGGNVVILKGTKIGNNCVVAAGCVLAGKDIPDNTVVYNKSDLVYMVGGCNSATQ